MRWERIDPPCVLLMHNPLMQYPAFDMLLFRARLLLEEGHSEKAQATLEAIQTEDEQQQREKAYFLGWCYILNKQWDNALGVLMPISHLEEEQQGTSMERVDRERHARCLLHLGYAAINVSHFEDAMRHLTACLKVLRHKHLQRPDLQLLRIQARYSLALTYNMRGLYAAAIQHYEQALRLFLYVDNDEELAHIYYGLCDTYRKAGQLSKARLAGEKALHLYERTANRSLEGRMRNQLGRIALQEGNFQEAGDHYMEALASAASTDSVQMVMVNCAALADLRLAEGRLEEAKRYCLRAKEISKRSQDSFLCGLTYLVAGKVSMAEAGEVEGEQKRERLEEALGQFEMAHTQLSMTEASDELAETFVWCAQASEALGRAQASLHLWKSAFQTLSNAKGFGWEEV